MTRSNDTVLCVVLNWNGGADTLHCVQSVLKSKNVAVEVLVVDNGSTDDSCAELASRFPSIAIMKNKKNLGVTGGFNQGIRYALDEGFQSVFFLNNDAVVTPNCVATLVATLFHGDRTGIVSPRILDSSRRETIWFDGGMVNAFGDPVHRRQGKPTQEVLEPSDEEHATGCAMLVRAGLLAEIAPFDERFFAYSEDADFSIRARARGWEIKHNPMAVVSHHPSSSVSANKGKWFRDYYVTRNKLLLIQLHTKGAHWALFLLYFSFRYVLVPVAYFAVTGQMRRITAVLSGLYDFMVNRFGERYS